VLYPDRGIRGEGLRARLRAERLAAGAAGLELPDWLIAVADRAVELEQTA
jgi:hypothetical protein